MMQYWNDGMASFGQFLNACGEGYHNSPSSNASGGPLFCKKAAQKTFHTRSASITMFQSLYPTGVFLLRYFVSPLLLFLLTYCLLPYCLIARCLLPILCVNVSEKKKTGHWSLTIGNFF
jgi:hypothetical protein